MPTHSILNRLPHDPRGQRGFTLIELMISLVIGLLLSAAIVKIYADTSQIYKFQNAVSQVQENGRFASAFLRRAARLAGNFGCDASNPIAGSSLDATTDTRLAFRNGTTAQPIASIAGATKTAPDVLILRGSTGGGVRLVKPNPANATADLKVEADSGLPDEANRFGVISDCETTHIFEMRVTGQTVTHSGTDKGTSKLYSSDNGARVQEIEVVHYCIGEAEAGGDIMALKRLKNPLAGEACSEDGDELVEGIQNLQVRYGVDTDPVPGDEFANRYITNPTAADIPKIRALRIELVVRSLANGVTSAAVPYTLEGDTRTPGDRHLYKVMTNTISLRNKGT